MYGNVRLHGPGVLHRIHGRLNMHSYMDILINQMVPFARETFPLPDNDLLREHPERQQYRFLCMTG